MAFWSDMVASPKLSYKWLATLGGPTQDTHIEGYTLRSFQKPSFEVAVSEYRDINDIKYKPGILTWRPIEITLVDAENRISNNTSILHAIYEQSGYQMGINGQPKQQISKARAMFSLGMPIFEQINADNLTIERWVLKNAFVSSVDFGLATYEADEIMLVRMTLIYDYAQYEQLI